MTPQEAVDIARAEVREAFFRVAGQVHEYEIGIRAWVYALTEALETSLDAATKIRRGDLEPDADALSDSLRRLAEARERYAHRA